MLSYDSPVSVNGQPPVSPTNMTTTRQVMATKPLRSYKSTDVTKNNSMPVKNTPVIHPAHHHIWLVTGPAGCGKSTVAKHVADALNMPYIEGDEVCFFKCSFTTYTTRRVLAKQTIQFHPPQNIEKMSNNIPLTDADRWDWLTRLREEALKQLELGHDGVVVTCSALKRKYRDVIRVAPYFSPGLQLHFIYLQASEEVLLQRVSQRQGHYMGATMVHSQFAILEPPTKDEVDIISVDCSRAMDDVNRDALDQVITKLAEDL